MNIKKIIKPYYHKLQNVMKFKKRIGLKNKNVSIISNNCGGGFISQYFGLPYNSPTAGLFFHSEDYVKFAKNPKHYLSQKLKFIEPESSKYYDLYKPINYPVALCDDIEIFFMHYPTEEEAEKKWVKRAERVNYDNAIAIFFENETTTKEHLEEFDKIEIPHKLLVFTDYPDLKNAIRNTDVFESELHHWAPEFVMASCDWKTIFNNLKGERK